MLRTILLSVGLALTTGHELATQPKPASAWALQVETLATPAAAGSGQPQLSVSSDAGQTFGTPIRLDEEGSLGRVDVEMLSDGSAAVAYINLATNRAEFRVKRVQPGGAASAPVTIANLVS